MKPLLPDIFRFESSQTYIQEFIRLNRGAKGFSVRSFAKAIKWPLGYLNDVVIGRKRLTMERAIQFGAFVKMSDLQKKRLVYMSLVDSQVATVSQFFKKIVEMETNSERQLESALPRKYHENIEYPLLLELAKWSREKISFETLAKLLPTFPQMTAAKLKNFARELETKGVFSIEKEFVTAKIQRMLLDESGPDGGIDINKKYAENFVRYAENFRGPSCFNSGFIEVCRSEFMEVAEHLIALRNWLIKKGDQVSDGGKEKGNETYIYQFDINLFPLLETRRLKDWDPFEDPSSGR